MNGRMIPDMPSVYLETTIISYLTARPSRDLVVAGHQETTRQWWETRRGEYRLYISAFVIDEASAGDAEAAERRMNMLEGIDVLDVDPGAEKLALAILAALDIPEKARIDAYHIGYAMFYEMDYLLTWNCSHLANGAAMRRLADFARRENHWLPIIVTPLELMDEQQE